MAILSAVYVSYRYTTLPSCGVAVHFTPYGIVKVSFSWNVPTVFVPDEITTYGSVPPFVNLTVTSSPSEPLPFYIASPIELNTPFRPCV